MSKRGKSNYFKVAVSDSSYSLPAAYAAKKTNVNLWFRFPDYNLTDDVTIYIDGSPVVIPKLEELNNPEEDIIYYNFNARSAVSAFYQSHPVWGWKFSTMGPGDVGGVIESDANENLPAPVITDADGLPHQYITATVAIKGAATAAEDFYNSLTANSSTICFDTKQSFVKGVAHNFGLSKSAKMDIKAEGEEDNNGEKESKITVSATVVGVDGGASGNAAYAALAALKGTRKTVYFIDTVNGLVKKAGPLLMNMSDTTEGNAKEKIEITGEETGAPEDLYKRVLMA